jgi:general secretion pathway protein J
VPLTANINGDIQPAMVLQNGRFNFSKTGVTDPLNQGIAPDERVEYQYNAADKKLYRLKYRNINQSGQDQPDSSVLLADVEQFEIRVLNPAELSAWPDPSADLSKHSGLQRLPRGLKIKLSVNEVEYEWLFSLLNTDFLQQDSNSDGKGGGNPEDGKQGVSG